MLMPALEQVSLQMSRLDKLREDAPATLTVVLNELRETILTASVHGAHDHSRSQIVRTRFGPWYISRFSLDGTVWISVIWPHQADRSVTEWLRREAIARNLALNYSYVPDGQIWIYLGSRS